MNKFIPLSIPNFEGNEKKYVNDALEQGWVSTGGAYITELERMLAEYLHAKNVAACQSGTSALHLSLVESRSTAGRHSFSTAIDLYSGSKSCKISICNTCFY